MTLIQFLVSSEVAPFDAKNILMHLLPKESNFLTGLIIYAKFRCHIVTWTQLSKIRNIGVDLGLEGKFLACLTAPEGTFLFSAGDLMVHCNLVLD